MYMYKSRFLKLSVLFLVVTFITSFSLFSGCKRSIAPVEETTPATKASVEETSAAAEKETVLIMANAQDIDNYNAFTQQYIAFEVFKYNCYETLLVYDENENIQPSLATSVDEIDDTTYQVNIRPNVKFHNGEILTAEDVKFTFNYILTQEEAAFYRPFIEMVDSMEVVDDNTLVLHLSSPNPDLLGALTLIPIVKEGTEAQLESHPIGTGPFKFVEWQPNEKTELVRFEDYWDEGKPKIDKLIVRPLTDPKIQVTNLESKTVHLVKDLPLEEYEALKENKELTLYTTERSNTVVVLEIGQVNNDALQNPKCLEAMWYAMDREKINKECFKGLGNIINGAYPSGTKYFEPGKEITYDIDKAKQLLAEAGYENGFEFTLDVLVGFPFAEKLAQIWQAGLAQAGITCNIAKLEASEWIDHYLARSYDVILNWYSMPGLDPSQFDNTITTPLVKAAFPDPDKILGLIDEGKTQVDSPAREEVYKELQSIIMSEYPYYIPIEMPVLFGWVKELKGVEINSFQHIHLKDAYFE